MPGGSMCVRGWRPWMYIPSRLECRKPFSRTCAARLAATRWPDAIPSTGWDYGAELEYLKELVAYWQTGFDWRAGKPASTHSLTSAPWSAVARSTFFTCAARDRPPPTRTDARLARLLRRVAQGHSPAMRPGQSRRADGRRLHYRGPLPARVWVLGPP